MGKIAMKHENTKATVHKRNVLVDNAATPTS